MASFYVKRQRDGRTGWVGSIRSERQAQREADAWRESGWDAEVIPNTPEVRRVVNAWQKEANARR